MIAPVNEQLGQLSETFIYFAAATYLISFILFTWDFAKSAANKPASAKAEKRELLTVGGSSRDLDDDVARLDSGKSERDDLSREASAADAASSARYADTDMEYRGEFRPQGRAAVAILALAVLIHAGAVFARGFAVHRVPWGNMYEFCTTGAFIVAAVYLGVLVKKDLRFIGPFVTGLVTLMLCAAAIIFPTPVGNLVPALQSYWIIIHVSIAIFASALFTISFCLNVLQLLQSRRATKLEETGKDVMPVLSKVPSALALENFAYRINIIAFVFWTFTVIAGAIWANEAWGRYWGWDPKEVWSFVIWVVYAAYLHARATRGWTGVRSAWLSIIGYACIIFNFAVVNVVFQGLHSYSGLK